MATLYISNPTIHRRVIETRIPGTSRVHELTIDPGQQKSVENLQPEELAAFIEQHAVYGFTHHTKINDPDKSVSLIYNVDSPVPAKKIQTAADKNQDAAAETAVNELKKSTATVVKGKGAVKIEEQESGIGATTEVDLELQKQ